MPDELISHIESKGFSFDDDVTVLLLLGNNNSSNDLSFSILPKLNRVRKKVIEICGLMKSLIQDKDILIHIELLLTEHLSNIIVHGRMEDNKSKLERIFLSIGLENDQLILMTLDKGIEWKYSKDRIKEDEKYMESGRGLDIINTIADKVSYKRINNLNESTFTLKIR
jgi:anti-sigma regulatory factor (Ser/Thr protein kinase)